MIENFEEYARYFHADLRVEVGIPVSREEVFRDWATVLSFVGDTVDVELSRDELPRRVRIAYGSIVDLGVWVGQEVYTCRAIVTAKTSVKLYTMRLLGRITLRDRRQFYRLNAQLRIRYSIPESGTTVGQLEREWEESRQQEMEAHRVRTGEYDAVVGALLLRPKPETGRNVPVWRDLPEARGVIGGGGIGFRMHRKMQSGELVRLELHLPLYPFRVVHAIAEAVYVLDPVMVKGETFFHTGMRYYEIDERDRDHVVEFISQVELGRLRELSERRQIREIDEERLEEDARKARWRETTRNLLFVLIFVAAVYLVITYLLSYKSKHHDDEIGKQFRNSLTR